MKTLIPLLTALLCNCAAMADVARPVLQSSTTKALVDDLATGAKKMTISATGTLEWVNGGTMSGASYFRAAAGLAIGTNVQAYDADLTAIAALAHAAGVLTDNGSGVYSYTATSTGGNGTDDSGKIAKFDAFGQIAGGFVGTLEAGPSYNFVAIGEGLRIGSETNAGTFGVPAGGGTALVWTLPSVTGTFVTTGDTGSVTNTMLAGSIALTKLLQTSATSGQVIAWNGTAWAPATISSGLTIGSTAISGGTSGRLMMNNAGVLGELALGSGIATWMTTPSEANLKAAQSGLAWLDTAQTFTATQTVRAVVPSADDTYSLGAQYPGYRFRDGYFSYMVSGQYFQLGAGSGPYLYPAIFGGRWAVRFTGPGGTDFSPLLLGPQTSSFPAISNSGTTVLFRLGDDSAYAPLTAGLITAGGLVVGGGTTHTKIKSGVATLVAGTVTVSDSDILETGTAATSSRIFVTRMTDGGTLGTGYSITRTNATSFTITSSSASETSTVSWVIFNP